jgi:hypothetical protein
MTSGGKRFGLMRDFDRAREDPFVLLGYEGAYEAGDMIARVDAITVLCNVVCKIRISFPQGCEGYKSRASKLTIQYTVYGDLLVVQTREDEVPFAGYKSRVAGCGYFQRDRRREETEIREKANIAT